MIFLWAFPRGMRSTPEDRGTKVTAERYHHCNREPQDLQICTGTKLARIQNCALPSPTVNTCCRMVVPSRFQFLASLRLGQLPLLPTPCSRPCRRLFISTAHIGGGAVGFCDDCLLVWNQVLVSWLTQSPILVKGGRRSKFMNCSTRVFFFFFFYTQSSRHIKQVIARMQQLSRSFHLIENTYVIKIYIYIFFFFFLPSLSKKRIWSRNLTCQREMPQLLRIANLSGKIHVYPIY